MNADISGMDYIVRKLTVTECERLQGLPDGYTAAHIEEADMTDEMLDDFIALRRDWDAVCGKPDAKPPTRDKVRAWLTRITQDPPDTCRYKAIGNGWACNQPRWIVMRMLNLFYPGWDDCDETEKETNE